MCIGVDLINSSIAQLGGFISMTGATYLFLRDGGGPVGYDMDDLTTGYGMRHNFVVINKQGIIRFNAINEYNYGDRYHRDRIRMAVDSVLLAPYVGVDDPVPAGVSLAIQPNPFAGSTVVEFGSPVIDAAARVTVHDVTGRLVATLWDSIAPLGVSRVTWDGRDAAGQMTPAGVYIVRANVGSVTRAIRIVRIR